MVEIIYVTIAVSTNTEHRSFSHHGTLQ